ncbi:nucleoside phosphatase family-domain-containing protein [Phakopsora pachyrhizi]|uniref:Nucleoside phosphatase family-domain-containing protein n=1 Tax=Phakopsora pachyrhizi TaxID=170000 RepID=A0AAV0AHR2_PHAPC|nr:nucleoside phosphatase family-domain-containing protein [Phakopsora pachyrhizi]
MSQEKIKITTHSDLPTSNSRYETDSTETARSDTQTYLLPDFQKNAEGGFGWIAVNYLIVGFDKHGKDCKLASTYGFLDMGGASTQIEFEPSAVERICHAENLTKLGLKLLDKTDVIPSVFITTWLGYGTTPGS